MNKYTALFVTALAMALGLIIVGNLLLSAAMDQADLTGDAAGSSMPVFSVIAAGVVLLVASVMYFPAKMLDSKK
ncbi:hypothetical protein OS123_04775 [Corynebacterium sp. P5875]|uniref:Uncharacterized protein n=1 Tax=Corynebacterium antarcticum TaxID=2800405 RepID=A0A9Q4CBI0_9CORY|nr:hypothetical protein [Corynebacterium antarcticum]MCX7537858.1 hypothetical protein [Corynebacterium antarcticum]